MKSKYIIIYILIICLSGISYGQNSDKKSQKLINISGKVLTSDKTPVAGGVLYVDYIRTNIVTNSNGSYKIKVSPSAAVLEVRSDIYGSCELPINGQTTINFTFKAADVPDLKSEDKPGITSSQDSIKKSSKPRGKKMNTYNDIYQMIRAEVPGVIVSGRSIQIQQGHSFFGSSTPLFVINGAIVESIDNVNPVEVKSIRILKGSEAAIYGVRGSNGVVSITLKNGTER
jgi:TonB-dependent SusC/RagA subfamily outer membrane receptor